MNWNARSRFPQLQTVILVAALEGGGVNVIGCLHRASGFNRVEKGFNPSFGSMLE
jgi:hypothetical protein